MSNPLTSISINDKLIVASNIGEIYNFTTYWTKPDGSTPTTDDIPIMPYDDGTLFNNKPINYLNYFNNKVYFISKDGTMFEYDNSFTDISVSLLENEEITAINYYFGKIILGTNLARIYVYSNGWVSPEDGTSNIAVSLSDIFTLYGSFIISSVSKIVKFLVINQKLFPILENGDVCFFTKNREPYAEENSWVGYNSNLKYTKEGLINEDVKTALLI